MRKLAIALLASFPLAASAQQRVTIADRGPGSAGRVLEATLRAPHRLVEPDTSWFRQRRGDHLASSLVVLGRSAAIEGNVQGDVVVVGGDLFVRPGARIGGRAVAIGGGVYPSTLSVIEGGTESYRDDTFLIQREGSRYVLSYQSLRAYESPPLLFPGVYGLRMPSYDRVNGLSIPFGPAFSVFGGAGEVHVLATYRSDLGKVDPSVHASAQLTRRLRFEGSAGRTTWSNDFWIWSNWVNSVSSLIWGIDTRNYYRADRAEVTAHRLWEWTTVQVEPFVGALYEDGWSVGPAVGELRGPWSVFGRTDSLGMYRPNPPASDVQIVSALGGARLQYETVDLRARARTRAEASARFTGEQTTLNNWVQVTSDFDVAFPTFGEQEYALDVHWVTTPGDTPPPQRFGYLGGSGTLPFLDLLEQGGDEVLLIDQRYSIPMPRIRLGLLGEPTLLFRHRLGSAGVGKLPSFEQVVGVGVLLTLLRGELQVDPATGDVRFSVGFAFSR